MNKVVQDQIPVSVAVESPEGQLHLVPGLLNVGAEQNAGGAALEQQLQGQQSLLTKCEFFSVLTTLLVIPGVKSQ